MKTKFLLCLVVLACVGNATTPLKMPGTYSIYLPVMVATPETVFAIKGADYYGTSGNIVLIPSQGNGFNLTQVAAYEVATRPAWSPDGLHVAFVYSRTVGASLCRVNASLPATTTCLTDAAYIDRPTWSPDGTKIAFGAQETLAGPSAIWTINFDGSQKNLVANNASWPTWSPDGSRIAYLAAGAGETDLYIMNADGTNAQRLAQTAFTEYYPAWAPDGLAIATSGYLFNLNGTWTSASWGAPTWSPDGTKVAYALWVGWKITAIRIVNRDNTGMIEFRRAGSYIMDFPAWKPLTRP